MFRTTSESHLQKTDQQRTTQLHYLKLLPYPEKNAIG